MDPETLREAARARYERGRLTWAFGRAWPALGLAVLVALSGAPLWTGLAWAGFATLFIAVGFWQRTPWGHGAAAGVLFSLVPLSAAIWMRWGGDWISMRVCHQVCSAVGVGGGLLWGIWVTRRADQLKTSGLVWAAIGAALVAGVGCAALTVGSIGGVVTGLLGGLVAVAGRRMLQA
jgi:hypothetical protein